jgi:hypothetical protein
MKLSLAKRVCTEKAYIHETKTSAGKKAVKSMEQKWMVVQATLINDPAFAGTDIGSRMAIRSAQLKVVLDQHPRKISNRW